jgi:hypothetical protein
MSKGLNIDNNKYAVLIRVATGILTAASFIYAFAYTALGAAYSLYYNGFQIDISAWLILVGMGLFAYGVYLLASGFFYGILRTGGLGRMFSKHTFMLNLDLCFIIGNLILGSVSIWYFYDINAYLIGQLFVGKIINLGVLALFYFLITRGVEKKLRKVILSLVLLAAVLLFAVS